MYLEVLCEGTSDVPAVREVLTRIFSMKEGDNFRIHPHRGKGTLPNANHQLSPPDIRNQTLLAQLPIKLKNMGQQRGGVYEVAVLVLVDADSDDCIDLKRKLLQLYENLPTKPRNCLFRIAVEETESWFISDPDAVKRAFSDFDRTKLIKMQPDSICGAWEALARALHKEPKTITGADKTDWAEKIAPHLNLDNPNSPSFSALIKGLKKMLWKNKRKRQV